jgi:hypothetical protein
MPPDKEPDAPEPSALAEALDRLYAVPLADFMRTRKELAAELKARGEKVAARRVTEAQKPTRPTWALNQVARVAPELLSAFVEARATAQAAQAGSDPSALRAALDAHKQSLGAILQRGGEILREGGGQAGPSDRRQMIESLEAAGTDTSFLRARLLGGCLEKRAAAVDPLAALSAAAEAVDPADEERAAQQAAAARERAEEARRDREKAIEEAEQEVRTLEAAARKARDRVGEAEATARTAARDAKEATARLVAAEARLRDLRER